MTEQQVNRIVAVLERGYGAQSRASVEAACFDAGAGHVILIDAAIPGMVILAAHSPGEEEIARAVLEHLLPLGIGVVTVLDYPDALARHRAYEVQLRRCRGRLRWLWRAWYAVRRVLS